jgi:hypothetical protein
LSANKAGWPGRMGKGSRRRSSTKGDSNQQESDGNREYGRKQPSGLANTFIHNLRPPICSRQRARRRAVPRLEGVRTIAFQDQTLVLLASDRSLTVERLVSIEVRSF